MQIDEGLQNDGADPDDQVDRPIARKVFPAGGGGEEGFLEHIIEIESTGEARIESEADPAEDLFATLCEAGGQSGRWFRWGITGFRRLDHEKVTPKRDDGNIGARSTVDLEGSTKSVGNPMRRVRGVNAGS